jgi:hypothetical protein
LIYLIVPDEYFSPLEVNGLRRDIAERAELWRGSVDFVAPQGTLLCNSFLSKLNI